MKPASWRKAKDVIVEALRLPADEREAFVRRRCEDAALCAEILNAIAGFKPDNDLLITRLPTDGHADGPPAHRGAEDLEPGTRVGPYIIIERIGRGGIGEVYLGSDPRLRRKVALKCLSSSRADRDTRYRQIIREARAAARVEHANVATIHDVLVDTNRAFIVMEYVAGESLSARLKRDRLPIDRVLAIGRQLASALDAAHRQGVVHRDLKPANVQFAADGSVKVLDFGIANAARPLTSAAPQAMTTTLTSAGTSLTTLLSNAGTPQYMSPEQILGDSVDERSDLYSLGLILFEMATGRRRHPTGDVIEIAATLADAAPRADALDPAVPVALADVIAKALETNVERRYQTAAEVEAALKIVDEQLSRKAPNTRERIFWWSARAGAGIAGVLVACLALGWISTGVFNHALGRSGFDTEPLSETFLWGRKSLVGPAVLVVLTSALAWAAALIVRLTALWRPRDRVAAAIRRRPRLAAVHRAINDPVRLSQFVALAGAVGIVAVCWRYRDVVEAWTAFSDRAPASVLAVLSDKARQNDFRFYMSLVVVSMGLSLVRVGVLDSRRGVENDRRSLLACLAVFALAVVINDAPYRLIQDREAERVTFEDQRCYIIGHSGERLLLFCPDVRPPRNRVVPQNDPRMLRLGYRESLFSPRASR